MRHSRRRKIRKHISLAACVVPMTTVSNFDYSCTAFSIDARAVPSQIFDRSKIAFDNSNTRLRTHDSQLYRNASNCFRRSNMDVTLLAISLANGGEFANRIPGIALPWIENESSEALDNLASYSNTSSTSKKIDEAEDEAATYVQPLSVETAEKMEMESLTYESLRELVSAVTTFLLDKGASHYEAACVAQSWQDMENRAHIDKTSYQPIHLNDASEFTTDLGFSSDLCLGIGSGIVARLVHKDKSLDIDKSKLYESDEMKYGNWKKNLESFIQAGFTGSDLAIMAQKMPQLLDIDFSEDALPVLEILRQSLGFRPTDIRRVLRRAPMALLRRNDGSTPSDTIAALQIIGMKHKLIAMEISRWPRLLCCTPKSLLELSEWLGGPELGMSVPKEELKSTSLYILRQAPWLAEYDLEKQLRPVAHYLKESLGVNDMQRVLRAYPQILCRSITIDLEPRVKFLTENVGINKEDLPRVIQSFPLLFAIPLARMRGVLEFLSVDLSIDEADMTKIMRAFPSLLGLESEKHMQSVVAYMRKLGIQNIGRFVTRLPPVLGYDVESNLAPKMDYLVSKMGLSVYDVLTFPAYFSYPLESIIEPRTEFLTLRRRPIAVVGLNVALTCGDADFAKKIAKVNFKQYSEFKMAYMKNRAQIRSGEMKGEDLLQLTGDPPLGNLGGLSTSSNIQEITQARCIDDREAQEKFGKEYSSGFESKADDGSNSNLNNGQIDSS